MIVIISYLPPIKGTRFHSIKNEALSQANVDTAWLSPQGSGFFLVRSSAIMACVPAREADVFLAWQARKTTMSKYGKSAWK